MSMPLPHTEPHTDRLTRLETIIERLEGVVEKVAEREGRPNWNMLGVLIPAMLVVVGGCFTVVYGPIANNASEIKRINEALTDSIQREIERNNRLEREMGAVQMINELFIANKLKLE